MRINIITFHFCPNYGAVLQTYALQTVIQKMGHDVKIIDYRPKYHVQRFHKLPLWKHSWRWRPVFAIRDIQFAFLSLRFANFRHRFLRTTQKYITLDELRRNPPEANVYISGSDQVWCPEITEGDPAYFLEFAPEGTKRVAYSASLGRSDVPNSYLNRITPLLQAMDSVSVREKDSQPIISGRLAGNVSVTLDPTLLLDDWTPLLSKQPLKKKYILMAGFQWSPLLEMVTRLVASEKGLAVLRLKDLFPSWKTSIGHRCLPSPQGYLDLFKNAEFVVTNSFHGTAFSTIFQRPFFSVALQNSIAAKTERMSSHLTSIGLQNRLIWAPDKSQILNGLRTDINWDVPSKLIREQRSSSLAFLHNALAESD